MRALSRALFTALHNTAQRHQRHQRLVTVPLSATMTVSLGLRPVAAKLPLPSMEMSKALSCTSVNFTLSEPAMLTLSLVPLMLEPAVVAEPPSGKAFKAMKSTVTTTGLREV